MSLTNDTGATALMLAAYGNQVDAARVLVDAGADVDHVNRLGWTALLEAVILSDGGPDHQKVVASLVDAGADRSVRDIGGMTALDHARADGQDAVVTFLERH